MLLTLALALCPPADAVTARWTWEAAWPNVNGGDWYRDSNNETAYLAWTESYVMMSFASMFRATGDPRYLDLLAWHADGVLAQRDDARGVTDYAGVSGACWQDIYYSGGVPYCWEGHSGMIAYPIVEFAVLVRDADLGEEVAYDGLTFAEKATAYETAVEEVVQTHSTEWRAATGTYYVQSDARFLGSDDAGLPVPKNMNHAMGRVVLALYDLTGDTAYLDMATAMAERFLSMIEVRSGDTADYYVWDSHGYPVEVDLGSDVSHAGSDVDFAWLCHERGIVFDHDDMVGIANTMLERVVIDDATFYDSLNGGGTNGSDQRAQLFHWLPYAAIRPAIYTVVRDIFEADYRPEADVYTGTEMKTGSHLYGLAALAQHEPLYSAPILPTTDWAAPDAEGWREAIVPAPVVEVLPSAWDTPCIVPLDIDAPDATSVGAWDSVGYTELVLLHPTEGEVSRFVPYDPRWPLPNDLGLAQLQLTPTSSTAPLRVRETAAIALPTIVSEPPAGGPVGEPITYVPEAAGDGPFWWSLVDSPVGARVDAATGALTYTPAAEASYPFTLRLENDGGLTEQTWVYVAPLPIDTGLPEDTAPEDTSEDTASPDDTAAADETGDRDTVGTPKRPASGCGCGAGAGGSGVPGILLAGLLWGRRRGQVG